VSTTTTSPAVLTSTLQALTATQLIEYYPPPAPLGAPLQQPSTDPAVYRDDPNYIKLLNEQMYWKYAVDVPNRYTADRFNFACKQWEMAGKLIFLPLPPAYVTFDVNAFDQWWAQYVAKMGEAPPLFFIKPATLPPPPVILAAGAPPPPPAATDGPIGAAVPFNPGVFRSAGALADRFPDGYLYAGLTGVYQKHVYADPFEACGVRIIWIARSENDMPASASSAQAA
jgi:hypothetical protein